MDTAGTGPDGRRCGRGFRTAAMLALVTLIVLGLTGAAEAKRTPPPKNGPDLTVSQIDLSSLPTPPFLIEKRDGSIQNVEIDVTVTNVGNRRFGRTKLEVELIQGPIQRAPSAG